MSVKFRHVGITVGDLEKSIHFYTNILGFSIIVEADESGQHIDNFSGIEGVNVRTVKMTDNDGGLVELLYYKSHEGVVTLNKDITYIGCSHFAVTVENLSELYDKLLENDVTVICEPQKSPDFPVMLTFCKDPDGTLIELVEEL